MKVLKSSCSGTMESSDIFITVAPAQSGITVELTSSVEGSYGDSIRSTIREVAESLGVKDAAIQAVDHGALDCTIRARVETALRRAGEEA